MKLPNKLSLALANYFLRSLLGKRRETGSKWIDGVQVETRYSTPVKWDKDACLDQISAALPKGWGYTACAGTFWFTNKGKTYKISAESWPVAEVEKKKLTAAKLPL